MFCANCGRNLPSNARFCDGCGNTVDEQAAAAPRPYTPPSAPVQAPPRQEMYPSQSQAHRTFGNTDAVMTVGGYIGMMLLTAIPLVGFILLLVWAFGSSVNRNKKNLARAILILGVIGFVISILFGSILGSMFSRLF